MTQSRLENHWEYINNYVEENHKGGKVAYIGVYGSQNYGLVTENSDVDTRAIYIPSIDEMIFGKTYVNKEVHCGEEHIELKDMRQLYKELSKSSFQAIEFLVTDFYIVNPMYFEQVKTLRAMVDEIAHIDEKRFVLSCYGMAKNKTGKDYHTFRALMSCEHYTKGDKYKDCIYLPKEEREELARIKAFGRTYPTTTEVRKEVETRMNEKAKEKEVINTESLENLRAVIRSFF